MILEFNRHDVHFPDVMLGTPGLMKGSVGQHPALRYCEQLRVDGSRKGRPVVSGELTPGPEECNDEFCLRDEEGNLYLLRAYYVPGTYEKKNSKQ